MSCEDQQLTSNIGSFPFWSSLNPEPPPDIFHDPRLRAVGWRDLASVTPFEILWEPVLPAGWLGASLLTAGYGHQIIALGFSFLFFLTGLRLIHNAFHSALGLSRRASDVVLWIGPGQALVEVYASGVCHTDLHAADGDWPIKPTPPFIPGHEGAGIVVARRAEVRVCGGSNSVECRDSQESRTQTPCLIHTWPPNQGGIVERKGRRNLAYSAPNSLRSCTSRSN